jgi:hypothetical protein
MLGPVMLETMELLSFRSPHSAACAFLNESCVRHPDSDFFSVPHGKSRFLYILNAMTENRMQNDLGNLVQLCTYVLIMLSLLT